MVLMICAAVLVSASFGNDGLLSQCLSPPPSNNPLNIRSCSPGLALLPYSSSNPAPPNNQSRGSSPPGLINAFISSSPNPPKATFPSPSEASTTSWADACENYRTAAALDGVPTDAAEYERAGAGHAVITNAPEIHARLSDIVVAHAAKSGKPAPDLVLVKTADQNAVRARHGIGTFLPPNALMKASLTVDN